MLKVKRFSTSKYDDTDEIKRMKDSDILAEEERDNSKSYKRAARRGVEAGIAGAATGTLGAAVVNGGKVIRRAVSKKNVGKNLSLGKAALVTGGVAAGVVAANQLAKDHPQRERNRHYNERLRYAKKQAKRREAKDWQEKTVGKESYTD